MPRSQKRFVIIRNVVIAILLLCFGSSIIAGLVLYVRYDTNQREAQKETGDFSGYVSSVEQVRQNGTTISVSITLRIDNVDPEIIVLGPEFAGVSEYDLLYLTGCQKNPKGFWENCQVNIR